jgi:hypothetical protein
MSALQERGVSEVLDAMWAMHLEPGMEGGSEDGTDD